MRQVFSPSIIMANWSLSSLHRFKFKRLTISKIDSFFWFWVCEFYNLYFSSATWFVVNSDIDDYSLCLIVIMIPEFINCFRWLFQENLRFLSTITYISSSFNRLWFGKIFQVSVRSLRLWNRSFIRLISLNPSSIIIYLIFLHTHCYLIWVQIKGHFLWHSYRRISIGIILKLIFTILEQVHEDLWMRFHKSEKIIPIIRFIIL